MKRTFNYTGRKGIPLEAVSIRVYTHADGSRWFDAELRLLELGFAGSSRVFVEAFYERAYIRFDFGTVDALAPPADRSLSAIDFGRRVLFRIKVVDPEGNHGRIIGSADAIAPVDADDKNAGRESLLPVSPRRDMEQEVWRVAVDSAGPFLEVNAEIEDVMGIFRQNQIVAALVFPQVLRTILTRILARDGYSGDDDMETWEKRWLKFASDLSSTPIPQGDSDEVREEEIQKWIDHAVAAFARHVRARDRLQAAIEEEA